MSDSDYLTWLTGGSKPVIRSDWDVYLVEDSLIYAKDHLLDGRVCVAKRELPVRDYAIAAVRTGQFIGEGREIWEGSFDVVEPADDGNGAP